MDPNKYFRLHNVKNTRGKQAFGYAKNINLDRKFLV